MIYFKYVFVGFVVIVVVVVATAAAAALVVRTGAAARQTSQETEFEMCNVCGLEKVEISLYASVFGKFFFFRSSRKD